MGRDLRLLSAQSGFHVLLSEREEEKRSRSHTLDRVMAHLPKFGMLKSRNPAAWGPPHSAGFAIRSSWGIGDPHDSAPRGSQHLSSGRTWRPV